MWKISVFRDPNTNLWGWETLNEEGMVVEKTDGRFKTAHCAFQVAEDSFAECDK
jgi:hypothetical protein